MKALNNQMKLTIKEFFKDKPVNKVWLFGSYARGEEDETSDVDVLVDVDYDNLKSGLDYYMWHSDLAEKVKKKVDVVSFGGVNKRLLPYIMKDLILIYER